MQKLIDCWAGKIAQESGISPNVIAYGIKVLCNNLFSFIIIMTVAAIFGCFLHTFVAYFTALLIKIFAGGRHASNPIVCYLVTVLLFVGIGLISPVLVMVNNHITLAVIAVALFGLAVIINFAPLDTPNKPIKPERRKTLRKCAVVSWIICSTVLLIFSTGKLFPVDISLITAALLGMLFTACGLVTKKKEVSI